MILASRFCPLPYLYRLEEDMVFLDRMSNWRDELILGLNVPDIAKKLNRVQG
jgi:hypothetical protein